MTIENDLGGYKGSPLWEKLLKKMGAPQKNEIYINGVYDARDICINDSLGQDKESLEKYNSIRALIKVDVGPEDPIIRGFVQIFPGRKSILAVTPDQEEAFAIVYGMNWKSNASYYASIESVSGESKKKKDVLVKFYDREPRTTDHIIITRGLAKTLGVIENQEIKILRVYRKSSVENLDKLA